MDSITNSMPSLSSVTGYFSGYFASTPAPAPAAATMRITDWLLVAFGLAVGMGLVFGAFFYSVGKDVEAFKQRVLTRGNFWLVLSGVIHLWIEGSFVFDRKGSPIKPGLDYYASGDLRYGDPMEAGTAAMEAITAILEGPLCWAVAYAAIHGKAWRHPAQLVLTTAQIYGLIWFILHPAFDEAGWRAGFAKHLTQDRFLFWFLVVGMNGPWAIFPPVLWYNSFVAICSAMSGASPPPKPSRGAGSSTNGSSSSSSSYSSSVQATPASVIKRRTRRQS